MERIFPRVGEGRRAGERWQCEDPSPWQPRLIRIARGHYHSLKRPLVRQDTVRQEKGRELERGFEDSLDGC